MNHLGNRASALLVTVNYKSDASVAELLHSLGELQRVREVDVLVTDNASGAEEVAKLKNAIRRFSQVELLEAPKNLGYFGGASFALDHYLRGGHRLPDWVMVCNHDVLIEDPEFFPKLFRHDPETAGVIAPRIQVLSSGIDQNPFMGYRPGWLRWASLRLVNSHYRLAAASDWLFQRKRTLNSWKRSWVPANTAHPLTIYAAHGSFLIFSRRYFEAGGQLDHGLFLYGEEISVAETCRALGLPVRYEPSLHVQHNEHLSTGHRISRFSYERHKQAIEYLNKKYFARSGAVRWD